MDHALTHLISYLRNTCPRIERNFIGEFDLFNHIIVLLNLTNLRSNTDPGFDGHARNEISK